MPPFAWWLPIQSESVSHSVVSDSGAPGTATHQAPLSMGSSQARILEWIAIPFSRGSSRRRAQTHVSCLAGRSFTTEPPGKSELLLR